MKLHCAAIALAMLMPFAAFADDTPAANPFFEKSPRPFQAPPLQTNLPNFAHSGVVSTAP